MIEIRKPFTHTCFIFKREGKRPNQGRWLECGVGRTEADGKINVYIDRLPVGGFSGKIHMVKIGGQPPVVEPERPARRDDDHAGDDEDHSDV
jgi:hypothetical protein